MYYLLQNKSLHRTQSVLITHSSIPISTYSVTEATPLSLLPGLPLTSIGTEETTGKHNSYTDYNTTSLHVYRPFVHHACLFTCKKRPPLYLETTIEQQPIGGHYRHVTYMYMYIQHYPDLHV